MDRKRPGATGEILDFWQVAAEVAEKKRKTTPLTPDQEDPLLADGLRLFRSFFLIDSDEERANILRYVESIAAKSRAVSKSSGPQR